MALIVILRTRWPRLFALFLGVLIPLTVFGALASEVWDREGFGWDAPILRAIHQLASQHLDALMIFISLVGGGTGMIPLCIVLVALLLGRRRWRDALFVGLAYGGAQALDGLAKSIFRSQRPHLWISPDPASGYGFPSGHAMGSMGLFAALAFLAWPTRWRWPVLALGAVCVLTIGFSRLYLGVHFPSDVLGAWTASLAWVVGLHVLLYGRPLRGSLLP